MGGVRAGEGGGRDRRCAWRKGEATARVTEDRSGATVVPAAPLDPIAHTHPLSICVRSAYYGCNVRGYAVLPGVGTSAMPVASVPSIKSYIHQAHTPWGGQERERERARVRMLEGRERTFCSSCLILLLWFCSSAAAHRAGGQHAVHNGLMVDRRLPSTLFSSPSILASPIRESVFKLCVSRMFMAPRGGTAAPPHG
jgi:hypothetical protein